MAWEIWPRDANLARTLDPVVGWSEMTVVERYVSNGPSTWTIKGPSKYLSPFTPGMGCLLVEDGDFAVSGQARGFRRGYETDERSGRVTDTTTIGFISDGKEMWSRLAWPDPTHPLTTTPSNFGAAYDTRTGARETSILGYIAANLGPAAPVAARRLSSLLLPVTLGRGGSTTVQARMDQLGDLVAELAEAGSLDVRIEHDESTGTPRLAVVVDQVANVSTDIVFGAADVAKASGIVTSWSYAMDAPDVTDVVLFAAGEQSARAAARFTDEASVTRWGRRRERLVDQRETTDAAVLADAAAKALDSGASPVSIALDLADGGDAQYRTNYRLGYTVGIELPGLPLAISNSKVREVTTRVVRGRRDRRTVVVGTPGATTVASPSSDRLAAALRRVAKLERSY